MGSVWNFMIDDWLFKSLLHHVSKTVQNWNLKLGGQMHHGILLLSMHSTEHPVIHKSKYTYPVLPSITIKDPCAGQTFLAHGSFTAEHHVKSLRSRAHIRNCARPYLLHLSHMPFCQILLRRVYSWI